MKRVLAKKNLSKTVIVALVGAVAALAVTSLPTVGKRVANPDMKDLGLKDFVTSEITYDGVIHELYWHYEFANQMIRVGRIEDARAHLRVMSFYINLLPYLQRDEKFFKDQKSQKDFDTYAEELLTIVDKMYKQLGAGDVGDMGDRMGTRISQICHHCHDELRTPVREITPYGRKIVLGQGSERVKGSKQ